jgi:hypothetical protein
MGFSNVSKNRFFYGSDVVFSVIAAFCGILLFFEPSLFDYEVVRIITLIGMTVLPIKYLILMNLK